MQQTTLGHSVLTSVDRVTPGGRGYLGKRGPARDQQHSITYHHTSHITHTHFLTACSPLPSLPERRRREGYLTRELVQLLPRWPACCCPGPVVRTQPGHIFISGLSVLLIFSVQLTVLRVLLLLWRRGRRERMGGG